MPTRKRTKANGKPRSLRKAGFYTPAELRALEARKSPTLPAPVAKHPAFRTEIERAEFEAHVARLTRRIKAGGLSTPAPTTRQELFDLHLHLCTVARAVARKKNADYGSPRDALANYRGAREAGVSTAQAIAARLADKFHRLQRAAAGRLVLADDDIPDAINMLVHLEAALRERATR